MTNIFTASSWHIKTFSDRIETEILGSKNKETLNLEIFGKIYEIEKTESVSCQQADISTSYFQRNYKNIVLKEEEEDQSKIFKAYKNGKEWNVICRNVTK